MKLLPEKSATTAIEYAIIAAMLSIVVVVAVNQLGQNVKTMFFDQIASSLN